MTQSFSEFSGDETNGLLMLDKKMVESPDIDELSLDDTRTEDLSKKIFSKQVESVVINSQGAISFLDAVIGLAEIYSIDPSDCASFLTDDVVERIKDDVTKENKIRRSTRKELFDTKDSNTVRLYDFWI